MKNIHKKLISSALIACMLSAGTALATSPSALYDEDLGYLMSSQRIDAPDGSYSIEKVYTKRAPELDDSNIVYDENYGFLLSSQTTQDTDGGYTVKKIYTNHSPAFYANRVYGTDTFTKLEEKYTTADVLLVQYQVTATFDWNSESKITRVYHPSGKITYNQGGDITNKSVTTQGNETQKSSATYSFTCTTNTGFSTDYSVTVSCDYNNKNT